MAQTATNKFKHLLATGAFTAGTSDVRMGLLKTCANVATSAPDINFITDMEAHADFAELTGASGYARVALTSVTSTEDDANDRDNIDSADVAFGALGAGGTIVGAWIYKFVTNDTDSPIIAIYDLTSTPTNGGTVTVTVTDFMRIL